MNKKSRAPKFPKQKRENFEDKKDQGSTQGATHAYLQNPPLKKIILEPSPVFTVKKETNVTYKINKRPDLPAHFAELDQSENSWSNTKSGSRIEIKQQNAQLSLFVLRISAVNLNANYN